MSAINRITSSSFIQGVSKKMGKVCTKIGENLGRAIEKAPDKDTFVSKVLKAVEPTGPDNPFVSLAALMVGTVIIPRVMTAAKRNPDNKEATKDEILEILFRDCQTVLIMLFALKSMNSVVAGLATKLSGLPMTNKPYEKLFNSTLKGFEGIKEKGREFINSPLQKLKTIGKNILNTIHPTGGVVAFKNDEFISKCSGYKSIDEIIKFMDSIPAEGGSSKKIFDKIMDALIESQRVILEGNKKAGKKKVEGLITRAIRTANADGTYDKNIQKQIENAQSIKKAFEEIKEKGYEEFKKNTTSINKNVENALIEFFKDKDNALSREALGLTAILKTAALGIEVSYLGFGLPALNQKRLEKKYLKNNPEAKNKNNNQSEQTDSIIKKVIRPQEIKVFHNFLK